MATLRREDTSDEAPLLGERGDASLPGGRPLYHNFVLGIALLSLSPPPPSLHKSAHHGFRYRCCRPGRRMDSKLSGCSSIDCGLTQTDCSHRLGLCLF